MKAANAVTRAVAVPILGGLFALALLFSANQAAAEDRVGFSQAELDQMLAPIALYPDTVLSHVLIAATYPLEVVQAARWSRANPGYTGESAVAAVEHKPWDPSVMALVAFPELLARMDADLEWTQRLGDAFLVQEYEVLDTVQYLRDEAYASGHLRSNEYVRVVREPEYIYIEPAVTRLVYVPYYNPRVVYGSWRYSAYPPVYWNHPHSYRYRSGFRSSSGFSFYWSSGHHLQPAFFFSSFHWSSRKVVVHDHHRYGHRRSGGYGHGGHRFSSGREVARHKDARHWTHNPEHRRGVAYSRGIDERHRLKASQRSQTRSVSATARTNKRDSSRIRQDLLRQRSSTGSVATQQSARNRTGNRTGNQTGNRTVADSRRPGAAQRQAGRDDNSTTTRRAQLRSQSPSQSRSQSRSESPSRSQSRSRASESAASRSSRSRASASRQADARSESRAPSRAAARTTLRQRAPDRAASSRRSASRASTQRSASHGRGTDSSPTTRRSDIRAKASNRAAESRQRTTRSSKPNASRPNTAGPNAAGTTGRGSNASASRSTRRATTGQTGSRNRAAPSRSRAPSSRAETIRSQRRDRPTPQ